MEQKFEKFVNNNIAPVIYDAKDLLSYASYLSNDVFNEFDANDVIKNFIDCRIEFKNMVESYLKDEVIDLDRLIDLGEKLKIVFYYDDPQQLVVIGTKFVDETSVIWILDYYKEYLFDVKNEESYEPNYVGKIGTVGYYGGYILDVDKLDNNLKELYFESLNQLERKTVAV